MKPRIMYVERKTERMDAPGRIGRVTFSPSGKTAYYQGRELRRDKGGYKHNHVDERYWISGPRRDGNDRLYGGQRGVEIDEDVWEEY